MKNFDVVVVGAGPAGGHCSRLLAKAGHKVLLVERLENLSKNSFSSAGTPLETLKNFDLPDEVVGSLWRKVIIVATNNSATWESPTPLGAVLDFSKFREFLAKEVRANGGEVWTGCRYIKYSQNDGKTLVTLKPKPGVEAVTVSTKVLVDATGPSRAVMYEKGSDKPPFLTGTGIEYLIEVPAEDYNTHADALTFFLGHKWIPRGYSWIFPMERNQLKVGAGIINSEHELVKRTEPIKNYIELIIKDYMKIKDYKIIDIHGSTLKYSKGLKDIYYKDNLIAIGDAVSTVNFLGGEGIRHAMYSAEVACKHIKNYLNNDLSSFRGYQREVRRNFYVRWKLSEILGRKKYLQQSDRLIDKSIGYSKFLTVEDLIDILFYYKFEKVIYYKLLKIPLALSQRFRDFQKRNDP
jgi:flavin-dependent dehydrogenase